MRFNANVKNRTVSQLIDEAKRPVNNTPRPALLLIRFNPVIGKPAPTTTSDDNQSNPSISL